MTMKFVTVLALAGVMLSVPAVAIAKRFKTMEAYYAYRRGVVDTHRRHHHRMVHRHVDDGGDQTKVQGYPDPANGTNRPAGTIPWVASGVAVDYPEVTGTSVLDTYSGSIPTYDRSCSTIVQLGEYHVKD